MHVDTHKLAATDAAAKTPSSTEPREPQPSVTAPSAPAEPLDLSALRKTHVLRIGLKGRKGHWVGHLVSADPKNQQLTIKVKWMAKPQTVSFADIVGVEARRDVKASRFAPVRLDA